MRLNPHYLDEANHAATALILHANGRDILMRMDDRAPLWGLAGGGNLDGRDPTLEQSYIDTVHAEVLEEANTRVEIIECVGETWGPMRRGGYNHERVYLARLAPNAPAPTLGDEGAAIAWFPYDALPKNTTPRVRKRIEACFDPNRQEPFSLVYDETVMGRHRFADEIYHWAKEDITGIEIWLASERVKQKIAAGQCFGLFNHYPIVSL